MLNHKRGISPHSILVVCIVIMVIGLSAAYEFSQIYSQNQSLITANHSLETQVNSLKENNSYLSNQLNLSNREYNELLGNYTQSRSGFQYRYSNTSVGIWYDMNATILPSKWIEWELLDTFVNHIQVSSNQSIDFVIFSIDNFLNYSAHFPYVTFYNQTGQSMNYSVNITQGCAGYVLVMFNKLNTTAKIVPDITATYAPTPFLTGYCAGST